MVAEFAVALPAVVLVVLLGVGALSASARQVQLQDAAADAARLAARGEPDARVHAVAQAQTSGARAVLSEQGDLVCVTVTASALLGLTLTASSCALAGGL